MAALNNLHAICWRGLSFDVACSRNVERSMVTNVAFPPQGWNKLTLELWTHARNGITENDFIVAAKINELPLDDLLKTKSVKV